MTITTILGSCVSVCLFDPKRRIGGMNHFVLPAKQNVNDPEELRFGVDAINGLVRAMFRHGAERATLIAKVFGGANMLPHSCGDSVGVANVHLAMTALKEHGIPVVAEDVGGTLGRKIIFDTHAGSALVKKLL